MSFAVLLTNRAVFLLLNARPFAPMPGGSLVGLSSGFVTHVVASPPALVGIAHVHIAGVVERDPVEAGALARERHEHGGVTGLGIDAQDLPGLVVGYEQLARLGMEIKVEQQPARALDGDSPQVLALRVEHDQGSLASAGFVHRHRGDINVALAVRGGALGMRLTRRQGGECLDLATLPGLVASGVASSASSISIVLVVVILMSQSPGLGLMGRH